MGNCCNVYTFKKRHNKTITLVLIGLDNAGKTTMAKKLAGESTDNVLKTLGFSLVNLYYRGFQINLYDLGGSSQIREIWNKYFMDVHGVIYVVDASDSERLQESKSVFADLLSHENVSGKPVLLLANKQDKENAIDELEIVDYLNVEQIVNKYRCPTRVETCSAVGVENSKIDLGIKNGYGWLLNNVIGNFKLLNDRVQHDMEAYSFQIQKEKNEWKKRLELESENDQCKDDVNMIENGDPFKPIISLIPENKTEDVNEESSGKYKYHNGSAVPNVLIDNFMKDNSVESSITHISDNNSYKTDKNHHDYDSVNKITITSIARAFKEQKIKLNKQYHRHKRKFGRFNKTAPIPMDAVIGNKSNTNLKSETIFGKSATQFRVKKIPENYLQRNRPSTAPPAINSCTFKGTGRNLPTPLEVSTTASSRIFVRSKEISDSEDVTSFD